MIQKIFLFLILSGLSVSAQTKIVWAQETHELKLKDGARLQVFLKKPVTAKPRSLPVILLFGGFQTGAKSLDLVEPTKPVMLVTFEYPLRIPPHFSVWKNLDIIPKAKKAMHQTVEGVHALVDWLKEQESVDAKKVILAGASFGVPFVSMVAGGHSHVHGVILVHGFVNVPETAAFLIERSWRKSIGEWAHYPAQGVAQGLWWYLDLPSPSQRLSQLKEHQRVLLFTAKQDDFLPPGTHEHLRKALKKSKAQWEERELDTTHIQPQRMDLINEIVNVSLKWIEGI